MEEKGFPCIYFPAVPPISRYETQDTFKAAMDNNELERKEGEVAVAKKKLIWEMHCKSSVEL